MKNTENVKRLDEIGAEIISISRHQVMNEFYPRIKACLDQLSDEDIWWRAHETDNSVGNLILHLSGNIRQWIVAGIGDVACARDRASEFSERNHIPKTQLTKKFEETVREADRTLRNFDPAKLLEVRHFQKWDHTCLYAICHVVEHVAQHMGQIIYITKLRKGVDLKFFDL